MARTNGSENMPKIAGKRKRIDDAEEEHISKKPRGGDFAEPADAGPALPPTPLSAPAKRASKRKLPESEVPAHSHDTRYKRRKIAEASSSKSEAVPSVPSAEAPASGETSTPQEANPDNANDPKAASATKTPAKQETVPPEGAEPVKTYQLRKRKANALVEREVARVFKKTKFEHELAGARERATKDAKRDTDKEMEEGPEPTAFHRFSELPTELRYKIVEHAMCDNVKDKVLLPSLVAPWPCPWRERCIQRGPPGLLTMGLFRTNKELSVAASRAFYGQWIVTIAASPRKCNCNRRPKDGRARTHEEEALRVLRHAYGWLKAIGARNRAFIRYLSMRFDNFIANWRGNDAGRQEYHRLFEQIAKLLGRGHGLMTLDLVVDLRQVPEGGSSHAPLLSFFANNLGCVLTVNLIPKPALEGTPEQLQSNSSLNTAKHARRRLRWMRHPQRVSRESAYTFKGPGDEDKALENALQRARCSAKRLFPRPIAELPEFCRFAAEDPVDAVRSTSDPWAEFTEDQLRVAFRALQSHPDVPSSDRLFMAGWLRLHLGGLGPELPGGGHTPSDLKRAYEEAGAAVYERAARLKG